MSKVADLKVTVDDMSEPKAYLTAESNSKLTPDKLTTMEKQMEKVMAFIIQNQNQNAKPTEKNSSKQTDLYDDPKSRKKHENNPCNHFGRGSVCHRKNCPFSQCNKSVSKSFYSKDFQ